MEDGVVVASRDGAALEPLETPPQYLPFKDARDHRLMAFRLLVRDFTAGIERGTSPAPQLHGRPPLPGGARCRARVVGLGPHHQPIARILLLQTDRAYLSFGPASAIALRYAGRDSMRCRYARIFA